MLKIGSDGVNGKMKRKLISLVQTAKKDKDRDLLEQARDLEESLGLLSNKEKGILYWGVYEKWVQLSMNSNFFYNLRDYRNINLGVSFSSAGSVLAEEIVDPDIVKRFFNLGWDIIDLRFVASDVIPEDLYKQSTFFGEDVSNEIGEIESKVEEAVDVFMSDIVNFASTYGWMKCQTTTLYTSSHGTDVVVETGISLKEIVK